MPLILLGNLGGLMCVHKTSKSKCSISGNRLKRMEFFMYIQTPPWIPRLRSRLTRDKSSSDDPEVGPDEESDESVISLNTYPKFKELCRFLTTEARIACHPVTSQRSLKSEETSNLNKKKWIPKSGGIGARSFATGSNEEQRCRQTNEQVNQQDIVKSKPRCSYCKEEHELGTCVKFLEISIPNRRTFIISKRLCWGCLKWGHYNRSCRRKKNCRTCGEVHPAALHGDKPNQGKPHGNLKPKEVPKPNEEVNSQESTTISNCIEVLDTKATGEPVSHSLIVPVWVHHFNDTGRKILTYALLDDQSDDCFIKDSALEALGINGPEPRKRLRVGRLLALLFVDETVDIALPRTYSRDIIPARQDQCPRRETAVTLPHLKRIASHLTPLKKNVEVGLLIGANCTHAIKPREVLPGKDNDPYGIRTALGWGIVGSATHHPEETNKDSVQTHLIVTREVIGGKERTTCQFVLKTRVKEILTPAQVGEMFEFDFNDRDKSSSPLSYNDRLFMKKVEEQIHQRYDGHFEIPLPLKNPEVKLSNNKSQAMSRLNKLKDRFKNDQSYQKDYSTFMEGNIKSVPSPSEAIDLITKTKGLCERGGFRLHKLVSNSKEVLQSLPPEERASGIKNLNLDHEKLPVERALGVQWCVESDTLQFKNEMSERPATRRGVLLAVSSVFDPLGLLSPFVLEGKRILQKLCKQGTSWDEKIPDNLLPRWEKWQRNLPLLNALQLRRCYKPQVFGKIKTVELHNFSDASSYGYGQCSYLRLVDDQNRIYCTLVMAKSRVAPLKPITISRLELTAALVSAKISDFLQKELEYDEMKIFYWTDSKVVLGYIANDARRFHVFVSNGVQQIRDLTSPSQWRYVDTKSDPADFASRGMGAEDIISRTEWWNCPKYLWEPIDYDQGYIDDDTAALSPDDPETKKISSFAVQAQEDLVIADRLQHVSNWHKAKKAVAVCLRFKEKLIAKVHKKLLAKVITREIIRKKTKLHTAQTHPAKASRWKII
ncbi:Hypothetical predicted protein [Paramuricea clavata]|uniref:Uncharacterized protein n=1 Tax=Paramuricea clavata TaxID=317549 RepID=A0A6S7HKL3_PARCT|nr:Hypothetical predicted protein [Paramuricea clavata]